MSRYYNKPEATAAAFVEESDGELYFKTGDIVECDPETTVYKIKGRASADIIKHKGYKISALDIENAVLTHEGVKECAVVGVDHDDFGQAIIALCVHADSNDESGRPVQDLGLLTFLKDRLAGYQIPQKVIFVDHIPRNAMGKVNKKELAAFVSRNFPLS